MTTTTITNLREEIFREFAVYLAELNNGMSGDEGIKAMNNHVDEILLKFKKSIDEVYRKYPERNKFIQQPDEYFKSLGIDVFYYKVKEIMK